MNKIDNEVESHFPFCNKIGNGYESYFPFSNKITTELSAIPYRLIKWAMK